METLEWLFGLAAIFVIFGIARILVYFPGFDPVEFILGVLLVLGVAAAFWVVWEIFIRVI